MTMSELSSLVIRPEAIEDFPEIAALIASAFEINFLDENRPSWFLGELNLVDYLRRCHSYVNELALVATLKSSIVGSIMVTPVSVSLSGWSCNPVVLSILAVAPDFQRPGIGSALAQESLCRASRRRHPLCSLLGHATHSPRFGFETSMFGETFIEEVGACDLS
jgi:predicted N-acetyltransferase YhbS